MSNVVNFSTHTKAVLRKIKSIAKRANSVSFNVSFENNNPDGIQASQIFFCLEQGVFEMEPIFDNNADEVVCSMLAHVAGDNVRTSLVVLEYSTSNPSIQILHAEEA